jgi:hypothetical protein
MVAAYIRTAHAPAAFPLAFETPGFRQWVMTKLIKEWSEKEKVDAQIDDITSQGNKLILTRAAELRVKAGHDISGLQ